VVIVKNDDRASRNLRAIINIAEKGIDSLSFWREYKPNVGGLSSHSFY